MAKWRADRDFQKELVSTSARWRGQSAAARAGSRLPPGANGGNFDAVPTPQPNLTAEPYSDVVFGNMGNMWNIPMDDKHWSNDKTDKDYFPNVSFVALSGMFGNSDLKAPTDTMILSPKGATVPPAYTIAAGYGALSYALINPVKNFRLMVHATTLVQLRPKSSPATLAGTFGPQPFDVFWLLFNFNKVGLDSKTSNYFILKDMADQTQEFQLGRMCPAAGNKGETWIQFGASAGSATATQLATLKAISSPPNINVYMVEKFGTNCTISVNGLNVMSLASLPTWTLAQNDCELAGFNDTGTFAMYTEDSTCLIYRVCFQELDDTGKLILAPSQVP
jgi:hypothetical protein